MLPLSELGPFAIIICLGAFTQASTGFAGGLVIMPLLVWCGHRLPEAQAALLAATIPQNLLGIYRFRHTLAWKDVRLPGALRLASVPLGVGALAVIDGLGADALRRTVSGVVVLCVLLLVVARPRPQQRLASFWTWLAFPCSGFFAGASGIGGPFMVLWVQAHDWSTERTRAFLFTMYMVSIPLIAGLLAWTFGSRIVAPFVSALVVSPLLVGVSSWGLRFGSWLGQQRLRRITMVLLLLLGCLGLLR